MSEQKLLALGVPTYNRPERVIHAIENAITKNIYDQIIVSSNSHEEKLDDYISNLERDDVTYFRQKTNVGMSLNYAEVIKLCSCKYLHIVSDEDTINQKNLKSLYSILSEKEDVSVVILSVSTLDGKLYKDASWQKNKTFNDVCGDSGHIGSSLIHVASWEQEHFEKMDTYCKRKGDIYPTTAAAVISYSIGNKLLYYPPHLVEMGEPHHESEMGGLHVYRFEPRLIQFISIFSLIDSLKLENKIKVYFRLMIFFSHHALCGAMRICPDDNPVAICKKVIKDNHATIREKCAVYVLMSAYYSYQFAYFVRGIYYSCKKAL